MLPVSLLCLEIKRKFLKTSHLFVGVSDCFDCKDVLICISGAFLICMKYESSCVVHCRPLWVKSLELYCRTLGINNVRSCLIHGNYDFSLMLLPFLD